MAAADEAELRHMVATAAAYDSGPIAFRYPRGDGLGVEMPEHGSILPIGKGRIVRKGSGVALLSFGTRLGEALAAAEKLSRLRPDADRRRRPFPEAARRGTGRQAGTSHDVLITLEECGIGGFGSHVATFLAREGLLDGKLKFRPLMIPDRSPNRQARPTCMPRPASTAPVSSPPFSIPSVVLNPVSSPAATSCVKGKIAS